VCLLELGTVLFKVELDGSSSSEAGNMGPIKRVSPDQFPYRECSYLKWNSIVVARVKLVIWAPTERVFPVRFPYIFLDN
jgi:hypothetical protein